MATNEQLIRMSPPRNSDPELEDALMSLDPEYPEKWKGILGRFATKFKPLRDHLIAEHKEQESQFEGKLRRFESHTWGTWKLLTDLEKVASALREHTPEGDGPGHKYGGNGPGNECGEEEQGKEVGENEPGNECGEEEPGNQLEENEPCEERAQVEEPVVEEAKDILRKSSVGDVDCDSDWEIVEITEIVRRRRRGRK
ncbi:hypothetical protein BKA80DRAFT_258656 [Phyllosticta citrichinensis]